MDMFRNTQYVILPAGREVGKRVLTLMIAFFAAGCSDDLLDKRPVDQFDPGVFYSNEEEADMALMGVYNAYVDDWYQYDFMSDNNYMHHDWQGSLEFSNWTHNSSSWRALEKWTIAYRLIGRANAFLENMQTAPVDEELAGRMMAEARFLRGVLYADLIHFYGDVPLILEPQSLEEAQVSRAPREEVLAAVLEDFDFAIGHLPEEYPASEAGRATKGAAWAFKARTYLYHEMWEEAAEAAREVIDLGVYALFPDYEEMFLEANENNEEVIFDIQFIKDVRPQRWPSFSLSFSSWPTPGVTASMIDAYYMTSGLPIDDPASGHDNQDPYTGRDPRLMATFVLPGTPYGEITFIPANDEQPTGVRPRKYADIENTNKDNSAINFILMRYADVLLMRAEALVESGNTGEEVYELVNQVRQRPSVSMPRVQDAEGTGLGRDELLDVIRHERRVEFAMEATRYSDIRRWELEEVVRDVYGYDPSKLSDPGDPQNWVFERRKLAERNFDPQKGWLWPIPLEEIQNNPNLEQNPGF